MNHKWKEKYEEAMKGRKMYASTHTHAMDDKDAVSPLRKLAQRFKDLGAVGFCLTQHGVLSAIEPMREITEELGLKFVPGIETYYGHDDDIMQNKHLILLSQNYAGYKAIWQAVSDRQSQNSMGRSVMSPDIIEKYFAEGTNGHGNVIATSACINGVIATILRSNDTVLKEIEKIRRKESKIGYDQKRMDALAQAIQKVTDEIAEKTAEKNTANATATAKFVKREKAVEKMKEANPVAYEAELAKLEQDKKLAEEAKQKVEELKSEIASLKKKNSALSKEYKEMMLCKTKVEEHEKAIEDFEAKMMSQAELYEAAKEETRKMVQIFGEGNFYMEIQNHGIDKEQEIYPVLVKIARELNVPLIAANDIHTVDNSKEELLRRRIIRAMRFEQWEEEQVGDDQLYVKTDAQLINWLSKIFPEDVVYEAMYNIKVVFDRCNVVFPKENHYPVFTSAEGKTSNQMLLEAIRKGAAWRFPNGVPEDRKAQINYEYKIIRDMGYADYHLIVQDFLNYGRALAPVPDEEIANMPYSIEEVQKIVAEKGWKGGFTIGNGRGSAVGSEVCYCLGITNLDPMDYGLIFERFLNPERVSMPDIDSDIANRIRPKVIEYVKHKYGEDAVCGIMTTNAQAPRGAIRIAAKYYGLSQNKEKGFLALGDQMAKKVPNEPGISFASMLPAENNTEISVMDMLKQEYAGNKDAQTILEWASVLEGVFTAYGAHAAGVVISDGVPVSEYLPLRWNQKLNEMTTQVDMVKVEEKGLIKMDFLGLKTLDIITDCIRMVRDKTGKVIDPLVDIPMDDEKVFTEIFQKGRTNSVFQFESDGMKNMLKRFKPDSFEDLIILVSMFRPGPLQYLDGVIDVKNGRKEMNFLCPELEDILGKTYGAIVYQEQVMEIFQKLAGYTLGGADQVRRYMSKKKMEKLTHEKEAFIFGDASRNIAGCIANGISEEVANELFEQMTNFARYAFNKSHAAAYAANSYYTAWLKYYYPAEFLASALNWAANDKIAGLMQEAKAFGVDVLLPSVNSSQTGFTVTNDNKIRFALSTIKSVGTSADEIISEREANGPFVSLQDFFARTAVKKDALHNLIMAGAFDEFSENRMAIDSVTELYRKNYDKLFAKQAEIAEMRENLTLLEGEIAEKLEKKIATAEKTVEKLQTAIDAIVLPNIAVNVTEKLAYEKELLGAYVTAHPMDEYDAPTEYGAISIKDVPEYANKRTSIVGVINTIVIKKTKAGKNIAILDVEDKSGNMKVCLFSNVLPEYQNSIHEGQVLKFQGDVMEDDFGDNDEKQYSFRTGKITNVYKHRGKLLAEVQDENEYHTSMKKLKSYADENGYRLDVLIKNVDKVVSVPYRVSGDLLKCSKVVKIS